MGGLQPGIALILRIDGHRRIAQHGLGARRGHHDAAVFLGKRVTDMVEVAIDVFVLHFQVRQGGMAAMAPVDNVITAVNQAFVVKLNKYFAHGL